MSGISEITKKAKSSVKKLTVDDLYDSPLAGNPEKLFSSNPVSSQPLNSGPAIQENIKPENQESSFQLNHHDGKPETVSFNQTNGYQNKRPQMEKSATFKMTFNLSAKTYKAFHDLYAERILSGRKTDKSDLICEAIDWLVNMENKPNL